VGKDFTDKKFSMTDRLRPLVLLGAVYLGLSLLLRVVLWWQFGLNEGVAPLTLPAVLALGVWQDALVLPFVLGPLAALLCLLPAGWAERRWLRFTLGSLLYLLLFGLMYLPFVEFFFFQEFDARFNLVAVDYLIYPHEVLVNIWESYPVGWVLLAVGMVALLLHRLLWPAFRRGFRSRCPIKLRLRIAGVWLLLAFTAAMLPGLGARSSNRVAAELSANGLRSLVQAFCTNELSYVKYYRTVEDSQAFTLMRRHYGVPEASAAPYDLNRSVPERADGFGPLNVVVIVEESFGAGFVGAYGDERGLTPAFDRLAAESLRFGNAFATGTRTVRGLEAITLSLPPIPSESVVKRPGCEGLANWGQVMKTHGYNTSFLYGGYGYFDNMNHFYANNGFTLSDRTDIPDPRFANIWGVSDEDLLEHALDYYDGEHASGKPFFSIVMTTSNHSPYTFPAGIPGIPAEGGGRKAGVKYADYALGRFMDAAKEHAWYDNTLFVIVADHDARVYGRAQVPVEHYRIPLLFHAPSRLSPKVCETAISQMDIAPTVLGLLGMSYTAPFYGQDVLHLAPGADHPILLNHNHDVALLDQGQMVVLGLNHSVDSYNYDAQQKLLAPTPPLSELTDLATAYYQTAFELFKHHGYVLHDEKI
jgi:phosphoglycerol transferase MdoB-like AlkP superfamily enzyme